MILFTGGKTAGHIYPLVALIYEVKNEAIFVGYKGSLEEEICKKENIEFIGIDAKKNKYLSGIKGYNELKKLLNDRKIDCVISTGGYVSFAGLLYAFFKNIPLYLLEENVIMGKANKLFSKYAKKVFLTYELEDMKSKYIVTGLPIRKINYKETKIKYDVLIIGGSLGSRPLCDIAEYLSRNFKVCLIAGRYYDNYTNYDNLEIIKYVDNIYDYMKSSKVIISRAGASTTYEIMSLGIPLIVCPSEKTKGNHQNLNALYLFKKNACRLVREDELRNNLVDIVTTLINNDNVKVNMIASQKKLTHINASKRIIEIIKEDIK
jgi:UDP-N-acetylglucosamine--N-acetylmuramyl-(pentapeptide) pyrophosphoryl-undecaprenol N-acetylglucosamine transferase